MTVTGSHLLALQIQTAIVHPRKCSGDWETFSTRHFSLPIALHIFVQFISQRDITLGEKSKEQRSG